MLDIHLEQAAASLLIVVDLLEKECLFHFPIVSRKNCVEYKDEHHVCPLQWQIYIESYVNIWGVAGRT